MKTKVILFLMFIAMNLNLNAQSVAVAPIKTYGILTSQETATILARIELIKMKKYQVLDEFDMLESNDTNSIDQCYGRECLFNLGKQLDVDYILSGNIDALGQKIVVNLKMLDIKNGTILKTHSIEFDDQLSELQRMIQIVLYEMHDMDPDPEVKRRLNYRNEVITSNRIDRVRNAGPRIGVGYANGALNEFMMRDDSRGGLDIHPIITNIGYQLEGQYVGTENFSALFECLINVSGLEQGKFLPSVSFMNGFRFGKQGWEFAFGPSFGLERSYQGFWDNKGVYGETDKFWTKSEFERSGNSNYSLEENGYAMKRTLHVDGDFSIGTRWVTAVGRTFTSGALNVPVNLYYVSQRGGGLFGLSVGFNISRSRGRFK